MKNIKSRDLEAMPMGEVTSKTAGDIVCLLLLAWRRSRIAMTLSVKIRCFGCSKIIFKSDLMSNNTKLSDDMCN